MAKGGPPHRAPSRAYVLLTESRLGGWTSPAGTFVAEEETETGFSITVDLKPDDSRLKEYFNICVKTKRYSHVLEEPEVDGARSDSALFRGIRQSYEARRPMFLPFGFRLSQPSAVIYVKFRLGVRPFVSRVSDTLDAPSLLPEAEVKQGNYIYEPCPIDEPPMDSDTFMHYFYSAADKHGESATGLVGGLHAWRTGDSQTAATIGAWLTTV
ncbi:hypothetical protein B0T24DRAFT_668430 [Lasiosphaeria ovina]|uniref:Uncharacterized protein n=1 Tax=Lasiosphaeria ovina TaxID=92902 RepID=A0AAE0K2K9_9PEZI|nr:hypothetical protein B0T24DRAFT_668430 [Lasiosphaeria ovina]